MPKFCSKKTGHLDDDAKEIASERMLYFSSSNFVGFRVQANNELFQIEFKDRIPPIIEGNERKFSIHYPVYFEEFKIKQRDCLALATPYRTLTYGLARRLQKVGTVRFAKTQKDKLADFLQHNFGMNTSEPTPIKLGNFESVLIEVKGAELPLNASSTPQRAADLRRVTLHGDNLFRTKLYQRLVLGEADGNEYKLSGASISVLYTDSETSGVVTSLSHSGLNYLRPGFCGLNLTSLARLYQALSVEGTIHFGNLEMMHDSTEI